MTSTRRLAAIMFTDIVGYSALMHTDEHHARGLAARYRDELDRLVALHGGSIVKHFGDGSLCMFTSTVEAVHCARELQLTLRRQPVVPLRIGLHTGDIVIDGDDIYGDGVNIASRVE
ncbi:MAG: adenylate/guanylate cyclase domain-containing protein, partial [Saprospiraceae bacterium]|nr:adenylate/guanylate cyclase domain-containing protein [Saprospiraceae bacterium]